MMRRILHIAYRLAVLFAACAALVCCSDLREIPESQQGVNAVLMRILPESDRLKVKAGENVADGEKVINSLRIYAFSHGQRVGYHYQSAPVNRDFLMDIGMLGADAQTGKQTVKFYIIANEDALVTEGDMPQLDKYTTENQLNRFRFVALRQDEGLPMFYADTIMLNIRNHLPIGSIDTDRIDITGHEDHLLLARKLSFQLKRPFGKLTLSAAKMSSSMSDVHIKSVTMLAQGTRYYNYLMPQTDDVLKNLQPRINDELLLAEGTSFVVTQAKDEGYQQISESYCFEVPFGSESPQDWNVPNADNSVVLRIVFSVGQGEELRIAYIYLPPVYRNEWILVNCTVSGEGQIKVNYHVRDWDHEMTDEDGDGEEDYIIFDYPTHSYLLPALPSVDNPNPNPDGALKALPQMSVSKPFVCYFQMRYPAGQLWRPTIFAGDAPSSDFKIEVFMNDTATPAVTQEGSFGINESSDQYFRIEVHPLNAQNVGSKVYLGVTAEIQGFGHSEYLLINGVQSELFWPEEGGADPNALIITQIE